jgi:hypothetical protein
MVASDVGVTTLVMGTLTNPVEPDERLYETEVKGVAVDADAAVTVGSREAPEDAELEDD